MNKHINNMTTAELLAALRYCDRVASDDAAPMQLRDEAEDLGTEIAYRLAELKRKGGAK